MQCPVQKLGHDGSYTLGIGLDPIGTNRSRNVDADVHACLHLPADTP